MSSRGRERVLFWRERGRGRVSTHGDGRVWPLQGNLCVGSNEFSNGSSDCFRRGLRARCTPIWLDDEEGIFSKLETFCVNRYR